MIHRRRTMKHRRTRRNVTHHARVYGTLPEVSDIIERLEGDLIPRLELTPEMTKRQREDFYREWQQLSTDVEIMLVEQEVVNR